MAYYDDDSVLVTDRRLIARKYAQWRLWVDLATTIPFDWIVLLAGGLNQSSSVEARNISLLRLLRLGRVYRLKKVGGPEAVGSYLRVACLCCCEADAWRSLSL